MLNKKWFGRGLVVAILLGALSALAIGVVSAQEDSPPAGEREHGSREGGGCKGGGGGLLTAVSEATGLSREEIKAELEAGATLAEIAEANGADIDAIVADALADIESRLEEAVADGKLTQEEADDKLADAQEKLQSIADGTFEGSFGRGRGRGNRNHPGSEGSPDETNA